MQVDGFWEVDLQIEETDHGKRIVFGTIKLHDLGSLLRLVERLVEQLEPLERIAAWAEREMRG